MVPKGPHVKDIFMDEEAGLLAIGNTSRSILFMECSTIDVATSLVVREAATKLGHRFLDCPVSGGVNGAYNASLTFMIGGSPELFAEVQPIAMAMGREENIYHCGGAGAGLATVWPSLPLLYSSQKWIAYPMRRVASSLSEGGVLTPGAGGGVPEEHASFVAAACSRRSRSYLAAQ